MNRTLRLIILLSVCFSFGATAADEKPLQRKTKEPTVILGERIQAFLIAYEAFRKLEDLPQEKKSLSNYMIVIQKEQEFIHVVFLPKLLPSELDTYGGMRALGREVQFKLSERDFKVIEWHYGK